jgi:hypothetical protein
MQNTVCHGLRGRRQMNLSRIIWSFLLLASVQCLMSPGAQAQAARTYVSGRGSDANACTPTSPCLTLQGALAKTAPRGEIYALDSANFGPAVVNMSVSIIAGDGVVGVLGSNGATGVIVSAGANDVVNLQGLEIDGAGSGANGIQLTSGATLNIRDTVIRGFANGISFQPTSPSTMSVGGTTVLNSGTAINLQSSAASAGIFNDVQLINNGTGLTAIGLPVAGGISAGTTVTIQNSLIANNGTAGVLSGGYSSVFVGNSTVVNNGLGLGAQSTGALLQASGTTVSGNNIGLQATNGGQLISSGKNSVGGNFSGNSVPAPSPSPTPPPATTNYLLDGNGVPLVSSNGTLLTAS